MGRTGWALYLLSAGLAALTWVACSQLQKSLDPSGAWVATLDGRRLVCDDHAGRYWVFARRGNCWVGGISQLANPVRLIRVTDRAEEQRP